VPQKVADIGAGTAVLAIAAAMTTPNPVIASDIDPVAVEVAVANARANAVADRRSTASRRRGSTIPTLRRARPTTWSSPIS
jgi:ribosomal protein L11 methyltransferase